MRKHKNAPPNTKKKLFRYRQEQERRRREEFEEAKQTQRRIRGAVVIDDKVLVPSEGHVDAALRGCRDW